MNNEPVAWIIDANMTDCDDNFIWNTGGYPDWQVKDWIPLYIHPAKTLTDAEFDNIFANGKRLGVLETEDRFCKAKTLTDEEILDIWYAMEDGSNEWTRYVTFARAILKKASEK